jgi:hypothetical protein
MKYTYFNKMLLILVGCLLIGVSLSAQEKKVYIELPIINNPDATRNAMFGSSVAMDGDILVVGSPEGAYNHGRAGIAYIYQFDPQKQKYLLLAKLNASNETDGGKFGQSVAISGDTIVIGAPMQGDDPNTTWDMGSAYVFVKPVSGWHDMSETAELKTHDQQKDFRFGYPVAIDGDTIVIGHNYGNFANTIYLYKKPSTGWQDLYEDATLTNTTATDFGLSIDIDDETIVAGASETVFLFTKPLQGWSDINQTARLTSTDIQNNYGGFGDSVSIEDDLVVAGAPFFDNTIKSDGAAYLFIKPASNIWHDMNQSARFVPSDPAENMFFGRSIAISSDTVIIGASGSSCEDGTYGCGSVYLYKKPISGWNDLVETESFINSDSISRGSFGESVAISKDLFAAGLPNRDCTDGSEGCGSVKAYLYGASNGISPSIISYLLD